MARQRALDICTRWLPDGYARGGNYYARNPTRDDRRIGSFVIGIQGDRAGRWADFAIPDARGGDFISLCAYLTGTQPVEAARRVARMVGHPFGDEQGGRRDPPR